MDSKTIRTCGTLAKEVTQPSAGTFCEATTSNTQPSGSTFSIQKPPFSKRVSFPYQRLPVFSYITPPHFLSSIQKIPPAHDTRPRMRPVVITNMESSDEEVVIVYHNGWRCWNRARPVSHDVPNIIFTTNHDQNPNVTGPATQADQPRGSPPTRELPWSGGASLTRSYSSPSLQGTATPAQSGAIRSQGTTPAHSPGNSLDNISSSQPQEVPTNHSSSTSPGDIRSGKPQELPATRSPSSSSESSGLFVANSPSGSLDGTSSGKPQQLPAARSPSSSSESEGLFVTNSPGGSSDDIRAGESQELAGAAFSGGSLDDTSSGESQELRAAGFPGDSSDNVHAGQPQELSAARSPSSLDDIISGESQELPAAGSPGSLHDNCSGKSKEIHTSLGGINSGESQEPPGVCSPGTSPEDIRSSQSQEIPTARTNGSVTNGALEDRSKRSDIPIEKIREAVAAAVAALAAGALPAYNMDTNARKLHEMKSFADVSKDGFQKITPLDEGGVPWKSYGWRAGILDHPPKQEQFAYYGKGVQVSKRDNPIFTKDYIVLTRTNSCLISSAKLASKTD
ncbi:hypothetical protein F4819DRAFT_400901 [Hypoxylon fuscum]|nr:hypothetical protein F4819DRAFT_400901 [Hypoxylon fuscum]